MKMNRCSYVALGIYGLAVLIGGWAGSQIANGACEFKCKRVGHFTTRQFAGDIGGKEYAITNSEICIRIWHADPKDDNYANLVTVGRKYVKVLGGGNCSIACYSNGGLDGECSCDNTEVLDTTETNLTCNTACQATMPM